MQKNLLLLTILSAILLIFNCKPTPDIPNYSLNINTTPENTGFVIKNPDQTQYPANTQVILEAAASAGYFFDHWEGNLTGAANPVTINMDSVKNITAVFVQKKSWTIMVYMDGDNNLEPYAIEDFNEMESVDLTGADVEIIVLFDRITSYDSSNNDWTNTRLYRVNYDPAGYNTNIISTRLASAELGISINGNEELNMGDPATMSQFINYGKANYPADNYCFLFWNHGSGWRSVPGTGTPTTKAVCIDDTNSGDMLYTQEIHTGLAGSNITIAAFDLCYGAMLEVMYEIRNDASYMIAAEETTALDGWDYSLVLNIFKTTAGTPHNFITSAVNAFAVTYSSLAGATLSGVDLAQIGNVMSAFNTYALKLYAVTTTTAIQDNIVTIIGDYVEDYYAYSADWNIDLWDFADQIQTRTDYADTEAGALKTAIDNAVVAEWHNPATGSNSSNARSHGIAVHLVKLDSSGYIDDNPADNPYGIDNAYWKNYPSTPYPVAFVTASDWVPVYASGPGLLYRLLVETLP